MRCHIENLDKVDFVNVWPERKCLLLMLDSAQLQKIKIKHGLRIWKLQIEEPRIC